jgi:hypothetical protein
MHPGDLNAAVHPGSQAGEIERFSPSAMISFASFGAGHEIHYPPHISSSFFLIFFSRLIGPF